MRYKIETNKLVAMTIFLGLGIAAGQANAASLDLTSVTPGVVGTGSFEGLLEGISVTGSLVNGPSQYSIFGIGGSFANSIIDNSSPQFSDSSIYTSVEPLGDKVGYAMFPNNSSARLQINFSEAVTNPIFHVANLDSMIYDFSPTNNINGLSLLSGNSGNDGDGLTVNGLTIQDANPFTIVGVDPTSPVPTSPTARSAYGSVQLLGTFTSLDIDLLTNPDLSFRGDGGAFTISTATQTPEPSSALGLLAVGMMIAGAWKRKQAM